MRYAASVLFFASLAVAQNGTQVNSTKLAELATALSQLGLTQLASVAQTIAMTPTGQQLLSEITSNNDSFTIFAPTDAALGRADKDVLNNPNQLAQVIAYHIVRGDFSNTTTSFGQSPNNTILPTLLNNTDTVHLQGHNPQVLVANVQDNKVTIVNQGSDGVQVSKVDRAQNFGILQIDGVLAPPGNFGSVSNQNQLSLFAQALRTAELTDIVANAQGITVFAPTDTALRAAFAALGDQAQNKTAIMTIVQNHIINGTTVYSSQLDKDYTSAAGQAIRFSTVNNTITVRSGSNDSDTTMRGNITTRDVLANNGVVHIINGVLANTQRDDNAASSAYNSATNAATQPAQQTPTGPIGNGPNAAVSLHGAQWGAVLCAVVFGMAVGVFAL